MDLKYGCDCPLIMTGTLSAASAPDAETGRAAAPLADEDFHFLRRLIYERSHIHLSGDKKVLVATRLAPRLRQLRLAGYGEYCDLLRSPAGAAERGFLIDQIATNHTHFFRERKHFDFLREKVLPQWRMKPGLNQEPFRVWSAACSSGEESYSLAIHLAEHLAPAGRAGWQIEASDISTRVLALAERGVYAADKLAAVSPELLRRYFQKGVGDREGQFRVKDVLRQRIRFHHLNLLQPPFPFTQLFHVIFCRNVMIYFDRPTQAALIGHLADRLAPGGFLMVGHAESLNAIRHPLRRIQPAIYLKAGG
jgi:chemotaxis protein methyltransferase CheR